MADYKSSYTGLQVDTAVGKVLDGSLNTHELILVDNSGTYTLELKGVTQTFEDVSTLVSSEGTFTIVNNNGETLIPSFISSTTIRFSNLYNRTDEFDLEVVSISRGDIVTLDNYAAESQINKVETVSSSSTNTQYPSAKCVYDITAVMTDNGLSNLSKEGDDRLHALKGYLESGKGYSDTTLYDDVYNYNHSTFDVLKFTKAGSPIITDNGVVSGFSSSNYITIPTTLDGSSKRVSIEMEITALGSGGTHPVFLGNSLSNCPVKIGSNNKLGMYTGSWTAGVTTYNTGDVIRIKQEYDSTTQKCTLYSRLKDATTWVQEVQFTSENNPIGQTIYIGRNVSATSEYYGGAIDLKQFSITVDGIPVFSGNKTGIDTIKPVDFTAIVNGVSTVNPTLPITGSYLNITEDGIASGFSADDYFKTNVLSTLSNTQTFKILSKIRFTSSPDGTLFGLENKLRIIYNATNQRIELRYVTANTTWTNSLLYIANSILPIQVNKDYYIGVEYDGININLIYSTDLGKTWNVASSRAEASGISGVSTLGIGKNYNGTGYLYGDLDLNSFKIYVNGNLIYQPCLLIPYTESSTGSKVVDVAYRDRVIDVYEQYGLANYYTIQENEEINYIVEGTPTINSNYIASGFSGDSYIKTIKLNVLKDKSFKITNRFKITNSTSWIQCPLGDWGHTRMGVVYVVNPQYKEVRFYYQLGDSESSGSSEYIIVRDGDLGRNFAIGDEYDMYYEFVFPSTLRFGIKKLGSTTWIEKTVTDVNYTGLYSINVYPDYYFQIGKVYDNNSSAIVDLKQFSIISNDELIFEAITKPNATLPMGEIYGFIGNIEKNKVTTISAASTDAQYPSAKCVYTLIGDIETLINAL